MTAPFNGLLYTVGSTIYNKANGFTSSETAIRALKNTIAYAEYPRYVTSNTSGTGGLAELLKDINSAQTITIQYQGKSTTSQARFTITANNYFLNQKVGEFEQTLLTGKTNNTRDWNKIACATFTKDVNRNIELVSVIPFRSSATTDLFEIYINLNGTGYDANSSIMKRNTTAANQNVIIKHQYFFRDVNTTTVEGCIYGRSTTGTITITGGNIFGITANTIWPTPVLDLNSPIIISDLNLFQQGYPNSNADLTSHSDVDVYFDFNAQGNAIDVNSAKLYYRPPYDDQNCFGVERTTKQCGWKQEASSSFFTGLLLSYFVQ